MHFSSFIKFEFNQRKYRNKIFVDAKEIPTISPFIHYSFTTNLILPFPILFNNNINWPAYSVEADIRSKILHLWSIFQLHCTPSPIRFSGYFSNTPHILLCSIFSLSHTPIFYYLYINHNICILCYKINTSWEPLHSHTLFHTLTFIHASFPSPKVNFSTKIPQNTQFFIPHNDAVRVFFYRNNLRTQIQMSKCLLHPQMKLFWG